MSNEDTDQTVSDAQQTGNSDKSEIDRKLDAVIAEINGLEERYKEIDTTASDSVFIVPPEKRAKGFWGGITNLFMRLAHKDPQYYPADEAFHEKLLGQLTFVSISIATSAVASLIGIKAFLAGSTVMGVVSFAVAGAAIFWIISRMDKGIVSNTRRKITKYFMELSNDTKTLDRNTWMSKYGHLIPRTLAIGATTFASVTGIMTFSLSESIEEGLRRDFAETQQDLDSPGNEGLSNAELIEEYKAAYEALSQERADAEAEVRKIEAQLAGDVGDVELTGNLLDLKKGLEQDIEDLKAQLEKQWEIVQEKQAEMIRQKTGTDGADAGYGPLYYAAEEARDKAKLAAQEIQEQIQTKREQILALSDQAREQQLSILEKQGEGLNQALERAKSRLDAAFAAEQEARNFEDLAKQDPRYTEFDPGINEELAKMVQLVSEAHPIVQVGYGSLALIIAVAEANFLIYSLEKDVSPGEKRAFLHEVEKQARMVAAEQIRARITDLKLELARLENEKINAEITALEVQIQEAEMPYLTLQRELGEKRIAEKSLLMQQEEIMQQHEAWFSEMRATREGMLKTTIQQLESIDRSKLSAEHAQALDQRLQELIQFQIDISDNQQRRFADAIREQQTAIEAPRVA